MSFIFNGLVNIFFEVTAKILALCMTATYTLSLEIGTGMKTKGKNGELISQASDAFSNVFSGAKQFKTVFCITAFVLLFTIFILKLMAANFAPLTGSTEEPIALVFLTIISALGITFSYKIFLIFQAMANTLLGYFKAVKKPKFKEGDVYNAIGTNANKLFGKGSLKGYKESSNPWDKTIYGRREASTDSDGSITMTVVGFVVFFVILIQFLRLFLEMYERYVVLALMFYTAPLAFATIGSRSTMGIFSNWLKMLTSQFLLMFMNIFFLNVFAQSFHSITARASANTYLFRDFNEFMLYMMLWIAWLIAGQKVDQHMQSLGMSTAQTGGGLASATIAAAGTGFGLAKTGLKYAKGGFSRASGAATSGMYAMEDGATFRQAAARTTADLFRNPKTVAGEHKRRNEKLMQAEAEAKQTRAENREAFNKAATQFYGNGTRLNDAIDALHKGTGEPVVMGSPRGEEMRDLVKSSGAMDALKAQKGFNEGELHTLTAKGGVVTATDKKGGTFSVRDISTVKPRTDGIYKPVLPSDDIKAAAEAQGTKAPIWGYEQSYEDMRAEAKAAMDDIIASSAPGMDQKMPDGFTLRDIQDNNDGSFTFRTAQGKYHNGNVYFRERMGKEDESYGYYTIMPSQASSKFSTNNGQYIGQYEINGSLMNVYKGTAANSTYNR